MAGHWDDMLQPDGANPSSGGFIPTSPGVSQRGQPGIHDPGVQSSQTWPGQQATPWPSASDQFPGWGDAVSPSNPLFGQFPFHTPAPTEVVPRRPVIPPSGAWGQETHASHSPQFPASTPSDLPPCPSFYPQSSYLTTALESHLMPVTDPSLQRLRDSIAGVTYCAGTYEIHSNNCSLFYRTESEGGNARYINLSNATQNQLSELMEACQPATFGRGDVDVMDESYRKAGKLDLTQFSSKFELKDTRIMEVIESELVCGAEEESKMVRPELYKLNVYDQGAFFKAHKDTPRGESMFASLVIIFATPHEGGALVLRHKDQEWTFDSGKEVASGGSANVGYVAFYSDVEHEVLPVTSGYRVTLTYNLYLDDKPPSIPSPMSKVRNATYDSIKSAMEDLLIDSSFLPEGGRIGFGLTHQYPYARNAGDYDNNPLDHQILCLKGSDASLYKVCKDLSLKASLRVVFIDDDNVTLLLPQVLDLITGGSPIEEALWSFLERDCQGEIIDANERWFLNYKREAIDPKTKVKWVTGMNKFNRIKSDYIAYGNEASGDHFYGDLSLIVEVGEFSHRRL